MPTTQKDLIHETTTGTGTGSLTTAAVNGKVQFGDATYGFGTGGTNVFDYYIANRDAAEWERGTGHCSALGTLVRDTVIASSNANALVSFSVGTKDVTNDIPASDHARASTTFTTGDVKLTFKTTADPTWIMLDDGSIGNAASGATTRANADCAALFALLYGNIVALVLQDSAGSTVARGASAAADFAANRRLLVPKVLGRSIAVAGAGSGLTARTLGSTAGAETETPTLAKTAAHNHSVTDPAHNHTQNAHGHGVSDPSHGHGVSDPQHRHGQETISGTSGSVQTNVNGGGVWWLRGVNDGTLTAFAPTGISIAGAFTGVSVVAGTATNNAAATGISINNNGSGSPLNILDPSTYMNCMVKL